MGYTGSYTVKSAPTVYAPSLTASVTETCWGSVSAAVSVVGVGATGAATGANAAGSNANAGSFEVKELANPQVGTH